jgi:hypothetical protein
MRFALLTSLINSCLDAIQENIAFRDSPLVSGMFDPRYCLGGCGG